MTSHYPAQPYSERLDAVDAALQAGGTSFQPGFLNNVNGLQRFRVLANGGDGYATFNFDTTSTSNELPTLSVVATPEDFYVQQGGSTILLDRTRVVLGAAGRTINIDTNGVAITSNVTMPTGSVLTSGAAGIGTLTINNDGNNRWSFINGEFVVAGNVRPSANNARNSGDTSFRWANVFGVNANFNGTNRFASGQYGGTVEINSTTEQNIGGGGGILFKNSSNVVVGQIDGFSTVGQFRIVSNNSGVPIVLGPGPTQCTNLTASGNVIVAEGTSSVPSLQLGSTATGFAISAGGTTRIGVMHAGSVLTQLASTDVRISNGMMFTSSNSATATGGSVDVSMSRAGPSTWQMGNGGVNSSGTLNLAAVNTSGAITAVGGFFGGGIRNTGGATLSIAAGTYGTNNVNPVTLSPTMIQSAGTQGALAITPTYNQTSTAGSTDLLINRTETALGLGTHRYIDLQTAGSSRWYVDREGSQFFCHGTDSTRIFRSSGATGRLQFYRPNDPSTPSVELGGGNDEIRLRGGLGAITHSGSILNIGSAASIAIHATSGTLTLQSNGSTAQTITGANTVFGGTVMLGGSSGPMLRSNGAVIETRNNANTGLSAFATSRLDINQGNTATQLLIGPTYSGSSGDIARIGGSVAIGASGSEVGRITLASTSGRAAIISMDNSLDYSVTTTFGAVNLRPVTRVAITPSTYTSSGIAATINATYNQTGAATGTDLEINRTETALGSGLQCFTDYKVGGLSHHRVTRTGQSQYLSSGTLRGIVGLPSWDSSSIIVQNGSLPETSSNFALWQLANGDTVLNAASGRAVFVRIANASGLTLDANQFSIAPVTIGFGSGIRFQRSAQLLTTQVFDSSLATWQTTERQEASATGARWSCLGATPIVQQTLPAAATDAATTQSLANSIRSLLINFGFAN